MYLAQKPQTLLTEKKPSPYLPNFLLTPTALFPFGNSPQALPTQAAVLLEPNHHQSWDLCLPSLQEGSNTYFQSSSLHLLYPDHLELQQVIQHHHSIYNHLGEELLALGDELGAQGCGCTLFQETPLLAAGKEKQKQSFGHLPDLFTSSKRCLWLCSSQL